jgi:thiol-disulfide isomerase/thioredoxin
MSLLNHYSGLIAFALVFVFGFSVTRRSRNKVRVGLITGGILLALLVAWLAVRPTPHLPVAHPGQPVLLELQSPYCVACIVAKPSVDRLEQELQGKLVVQRANIQSDSGKSLAARYEVEATPTFIFLDAAGKEQWRGFGILDASEIRALMKK